MDETVTTKINADIMLCEPKGGIRFGTDALLLAFFALKGTKKGICADLGTGSGVIPLLLLSSGSRAKFVCAEISEKYASCAECNAKGNGFSDRMKVFCTDVRNTENYCAFGTADSVVTNPPYMRAECGKDNALPDMSRARRDVCGGIKEFCVSASKILKNGGKFYAVYRPDRTAELLCSMRSCNIEPKRLRAVVPSVGQKPSLILCEGKKDANEGMVFEEDLCIYSDTSHREFSDTMKEIYKQFSEDKRAK